MEAKDFWNDRYFQKEYAYGQAPNAFFKEVLDTYSLSGSILLPAEGEGRNAVYAAKKGLEVLAFDISEEGRKKALRLAQLKNVEIIYELKNISDLDITNREFDAAALIYAHFPSHLRYTYHRKIAELIKPNGWLIIEAFTKKQLELRKKYPNNGGPSNIDVLFSKEIILKDFFDFEMLSLHEEVIDLEEGLFHNGRSSVVRFVGKKRV